MNDNVRDDRTSVYEIGYLLAGIPEERVAPEADVLKSVITKAGGSVLAEEAPKHEHLAYTMRKKTVSGSYEKYDAAYFGWVKFDLTAHVIEEVKKAIESMPPILRILVITTVRENTYLGKRAPAVVATFSRRPIQEGEAAPVEKAPAPVQPATVEEMDKSIDEMVKEV